MTKLSPRGDGYTSRGVWQESRANLVTFLFLMFLWPQKTIQPGSGHGRSEVKWPQMLLKCYCRKLGTLLRMLMVCVLLVVICRISGRYRRSFFYSYSLPKMARSKRSCKLMCSRSVNGYSNIKALSWWVMRCQLITYSRCHYFVHTQLTLPLICVHTWISFCRKFNVL